ncbi:MAG TPA: hypothetical protein VJM08_15880 [Anaerolineales bacterium]|nr:hypothetical protein [Anaerolineales bacterium]
MREAMARTGEGGGFGRLLLTMILLAIIASTLVVMTRAHARRHDKHVKDIPDKCNSNSFQIHMYRPSDGRDAFLCFIEGYFVVSIWNFRPEKIAEYGDDEVTSFARPKAQSMDDLISYMEGESYTVTPWVP